MGSVQSYSTAAGRRYRVRYRTPDHRQTDRRGFATKREAELFLATVEVTKARGEYVELSASRATLYGLGTEWLANQTHLKPSSLAPVANAWRTFVAPRWGSRQVGEIRHSEIQSWVRELTAGDEKPRSATTVIRAFGVLAAILDVAVRDRRILSNPARGVNLPRKTTKEHIYLSHDEVHALANNSGDKAALVLLLAYTGLRWGEAIALRVRDVDHARRRITVSMNAVEVGGAIEVGTPKSHKRRTVPFPRLLATALIERAAGKTKDDLLFGDANGDHMRRTRVSTGSRSWFKTALTDAGLDPMTLHDLRHTAASLAISAGANVKAVQRMLGHASAAMTLDTYSDLFDDDLNDVSDRLDQAYEESIVGKAWADRALDSRKPAESQ
jgi:integrase